MGRRSSAAARFGSPSWTRTNDTAVNSRVLYRLSYGGIFEVARPSQTRPLRMLALPIFPVRLQTSIVGRSELNFRVRDGNGWTLAAISTNLLSFEKESKQRKPTIFLSLPSFQQ